jgi:tetratricopeptide (TPR) repeat protein
MPLRAIGFFRVSKDGDIEGKEYQTRRLISLPFRILALPLTLTFRFVRNRQPAEILAILPLVVFLALLTFISYRVIFSSDTTQRLYYMGARRAVSQGDSKLAKRYFERITDYGNLSDAMKHDWATVLLLSGENQKATRIFDEIAPDGKEGFPLAHQSKAIQLVGQIDVENSKPDDQIWENIRWHLDHASPGAQLEQAWAKYFIGLDQPENAIVHLQSAAEEFPQLHFSLADLCDELDRSEDCNKALNAAKNRFGTMLRDDPLDQSSRVALTKALVELGQFDEAEKTVTVGFQIFGTSQWSRIASNFYVGRSQEVSLGARERFGHILRAVLFDGENPGVYDEIINFCTNLKDDYRKDALFDIVTSESSNGLAHLCLAYIYRIEGNDADSTFHLNQSLDMEQRFGEIAGRLAVRVSSISKPNFEWSLILVNACKSKHPEDSQYSIRLAEVLLLQSRTEDAITELKATLNSANGRKRKTLELLSYAYQQLGDLNQARSFATQAGELANQP